METLPLVFYGTVIHSLSLTELQIVQSCLLAVGIDGTIRVFEKNVKEEAIGRTLISKGFQETVSVTVLKRGQFLIPGFVDTHNHAPQWAQRGQGTGRELLEWLDRITFPHEARYAEPVYARKMYASCVKGFIKQGVTTASYYGSLHGEATKILAETCLAMGQRAYVGKCNMNRNSPAWYRDASAKESLDMTEDFIAHVRKIDPGAALLKPIITPRFAISCDADVLAGLGRIAAANDDLPIQTHFHESVEEVNVTKQWYPEFESEADLYEHFGLMNNRTIMAHCVYAGDYEIRRLKALGCGIAHCPIPIMTGGSYGSAPVREFLRRGIKVGLGTDSGGGYSSSILDAMRGALINSKVKERDTNGLDACLSVSELFFLATLGGAQVCNLDKKIGNFVTGKEFDSLLIDTMDEKNGILTVVEEEDTIEDIFDKFLFSGDDRNIATVYVKGRSIKK